MEEPSDRPIGGPGEVSRKIREIIGNRQRLGKGAIAELQALADAFDRSREEAPSRQGDTVVEGALEESEQKYRAFFDHLREFVVILDIVRDAAGKPADGLFTDANLVTAGLLGMDRGDLIGKRASEVMEPEEHARILKGVLGAERTGRPQSWEGILRGRSYGVSLFPIEADRFAVVGYDVTDRVMAGEDLRRANAELTTINRVIRCANSSVDLEEIFTRVLSSLVESLGYDCGWIYLRDKDGRRARLIAAVGVPGGFADNRAIRISEPPYNVIFAAGHPRFVENTPANPPGTLDARILESVDAISYAAVPLMADPVVLGALFLARRTRGTIPATDRRILQLVGRELGGTIFRGILQEHLMNAIREGTFYLDLLSTDVLEATGRIAGHGRSLRAVLDGQAGRFVDLQMEEVDKIHDLIGNVTMIRRIPAGREDLGAVDLDRVIRDVRDRFPATAIVYEDTGILVAADEYLQDVFTNLVGNSIKFGGPDVRIRIQARETGGRVRVTVEDNGPGMPDHRKSMFFRSPQYPIEEAGGNTMGLALVRRIIDRYGGTIGAEDRVPGRPAGGLAVHLTLLPAPGAPPADHGGGAQPRPTGTP